MNFIKTFEQLDPANSLSKEQINFLNELVKGSWNFVNGFVDVEGDFYWFNTLGKDFKGIKFGKVSGYFNCSLNRLTSLEGAPQKVGGSFYCYGNKLTSLVGRPKKIGGDFYCFSNQLTSLTGAPQKVGGSFDCSDNLLTSLIGAPQKIGGNFICRGNLVSLETLHLLWDKLKEIPIYSIALASIWSKIPEVDRKLMKKDLDPDYLDYSQLGDFGLI